MISFNCQSRYLHWNHRLKKKKSNPKADNIDTLLKLYQIYDNHRNAILWFLEELDGSYYKKYFGKIF
jgi:hypothetical protein